MVISSDNNCNAIQCRQTFELFKSAGIFDDKIN